MEEQNDDVETPKHMIKTEEAEEKQDSPQSHIGYAGQTSVDTSPAKSQVHSEGYDEEDYDIWGPIPWAPEDDPLMGDITRALRAADIGSEEKVEEGDVGAEGLSSIEQKTNFQFKYNEELLKGLGLGLGIPVLFGKVAKAEEYDEEFAEELAKGSKMTPEELIADIIRLDEEILAEPNHNTKTFELMGGIAEKLTAGGPSKE